MDKRRNFEKFNEFMNDNFPRASLTAKAIAECVWDKLQIEIEAIRCLNRSYSKIIDDHDNSAAPAPEVEPVYQVFDAQSAWNDVPKTRFDWCEQKGFVCRKLFTSPPSPKASWDADGNPMNLEAAARDALAMAETNDWDGNKIEHIRTVLRKFLPEGKS